MSILYESFSLFPPQNEWMNERSQKKKGTKAVTGAVPFQKVHFCTQRLHIGNLVVHIST